MTKTLIKVGLGFLLIAGGVFICLILFLKPLAETVLRKAGYPQATAETAALGHDGLLLGGVDLKNGMKIESLKVSVDFNMLLARKVNAAALAVAGGSYSLLTPFGILPVRGEGTMRPYGEGWRWNAEVGGENDNMKLSGRLTAELGPGAPPQIHFELAEGRITTPDFTARRMTGWVAFGEKPGGQVMAGAVEGQGVALHDVTVTLTGDGQILTSGADSAGKRVYIDFRPDGVFCNGRPAPFAVSPVPSEVLRLAKACAGTKE